MESNAMPNNMHSNMMQINKFNDASGLVTVSVFSRTWGPAKSIWKDVELLLPDKEMIAIGGGGKGVEFPAGGYLTASYPNDDLSGWLVSSKDHSVVNPHELTTYVIGMKIKGMSRDQLYDSINMQVADSGLASHPEAEAFVPSDDFVLISGGFKVDYRGYGNIATASFPSSKSSWRACSKDHTIVDPANLRVYAIYIKRDLKIGKVSVSITKEVSNQSNHPAAVATVQSGFALVGGGAEVHWNGYGNLLWKLEPSITVSQSFSAASKDQEKEDLSTITTYAMGISIKK